MREEREPGVIQQALDVMLKEGKGPGLTHRGGKTGDVGTVLRKAARDALATITFSHTHMATAPQEGVRASLGAG
jgi:hypothetical protein